MKQPNDTRRGMLFKLPQNFYARPELHILCGGAVQIDRCGKILEFTKEQLSVCAGRWKVTLYGNGLVISSLAGQRLLITGKITRAEFALLPREGKIR